ncbi:right-handed parallel beta-helix repeat-containing protein [Niabella pedocola]|uniref:Right-handed parallel beta-helix repeat-containing protein n=1 Tax=Niabella pedocola TaxID=1752077 RepID=A0ABS8PZM3_9BACT|nr:right-handed parallel beta-helix repeat-containing protein [Niabella pedocola]MCD2425798.1 right-handed parallel beta-helix repeat-containing protein [Niabella pedocola]
MKRTTKRNGLLCMMVMTVLIACGKPSFQDLKNNGNGKPPAHTYYVAADGNDAANGSSQAPWKSINNALAKVVAGDTVQVRGGIYYEKISFTRSGIPGMPVVLKAAGEARPVIDGSRISVNGWEALVTISNTQHIVMEGFDIRNLTTSVKGADPEGILINGSSKHITIRNCNIYDIKHTATLENWRSAHAILVLGNGAQPITGIEISGCTVHDTKTGTSENITLAGNVDGFTIAHNRVYNTENIGIIIADGGGLNPGGDPATNFARNGVVSDNELYNVSMANSTDVWGLNNYGAIAIYICGGAHTVVERNRVYNNDRGIGLVSENNAYPTKQVIVRNNFVYNNWRTGIYMGDYLNFTTAGTYNCYVVNNTLFQNNKTTGAFGEIEGEIRLTERCFNNVIRNNIIYAGPEDVFVHKYTGTGADNMIDNNLYYTRGTPQWIWNSTNGTALKSMEAWRAASGGDAGSVYGLDPLLVNLTVPDLHLQAGSPARNTGVVISAEVNGTTDIDGRPRIVENRISKGAQQ